MHTLLGAGLHVFDQLGTEHELERTWVIESVLASLRVMSELHTRSVSAR